MAEDNVELDEDLEELEEEERSIAPWINWMRDAAPYIHALRGKTFVVGLAGEMIENGKLDNFIHDISMVSAMGARLVLVYGVRPQVNALMKLKGVESKFVNTLRITDNDTLSCVKEASGEVRLDIEAAFSQGLPNTPMAHSHIRVVSGNFVTARPVGIIDGVDFKLTGVIRKVDTEAINNQLDDKNIILIGPIGFSPTGEAFNIVMEDVVTEIAIALKAEKLILLTNVKGVRRFGEVVSELTVEDAEEFIQKKLIDAEDIYNLGYAIKALKNGVNRVHILPYFLDGGILAELFTHDGVGTMITEENMDALRPATIDDVQGLIQLLTPLEENGTLVKRPREKLEADISKFVVLDHDGIIYGCAALYPFPDEEVGELAAFVIHPDYQGSGDGERLLKMMERRAKQLGLLKLFVLTTRTAHWFLKRGFKAAAVDDLPVEKRELYNWQRRSQIFIKDL